MRDGLYHYLVGFPKVTLPVEPIELEYSKHAKREMMSDRYGIISPPRFLHMYSAKVVEIEILEGKLVKILARIRYDERHDLVLAVKPNGFVKTVWLNTREDKHRTLDKSKYLKP